MLFNDLNSVATGTDRAPPAIAAAEHLAAAAWARPLLSYSCWCPDVQPGAKRSLVDKVLLAYLKFTLLINLNSLILFNNMRL